MDLWCCILGPSLWLGIISKSPSNQLLIYMIRITYYLGAGSSVLLQVTTGLAVHAISSHLILESNYWWKMYKISTLKCLFALICATWKTIYAEIISVFYACCKKKIEFKIKFRRCIMKRISIGYWLIYNDSSQCLCYKMNIWKRKEMAINLGQLLFFFTTAHVLI